MNFNSKYIKIYLLILSLVIIAVVITVLKVRQNNQPNVEITSSPENISLSINNVEYHTPAKIKLDVGKTYTIWGFATNYQVSKKDYVIQKGQNKINIVLQQETQYIPPEGAPVQ